MREQDYVTKEIAKILKKKDFPFNDTYKRVIRNGEEVLYFAHDSSFDNISNDEIRPLSSDVQNWLREQYGLYIEIYRDNGNWKYVTYDLYGNFTVEKYINFELFLSNIEFETYEETVNDAIKECLNYI